MSLNSYYPARSGATAEWQAGLKGKTPYHVTVVRDELGLQELEKPWSLLLGRSHASSIFVSFPWNAAWWHSFGAGKRLYIIVARDIAGEVRGIAPCMLVGSGTLRKLEWIGTGLSDTGDFLLDESCAEDVAQEMFDHLQQHRRDWDLIDLDEVPPYSLLAGWLQSRKSLGQRVIQLPRTDCPFIALPSTGAWADYVQTLQRKPRQHLESFARRVMEENGTHFHLVTEEAEVPAAVARFYELHRARWTTKDGELNPEHTRPDFLPFLEEVCRRAAAHGLLRLAELGIGDTTISSWISFQVNGRWNGYMTGFDPRWSSMRPGKVLHGFVVRQALAEHATELDLGRGNEAYKYELGAVERKNTRIVIANDTARSGLAFSRALLRMQARELVHRLDSARASST